MKKNISRRVMSAVLGAALLVSSGVPVYALGTGNSDVTLQVETGEEPSIVSVKVPTEIPLKMDKEGVVTVPQDLKITNLSDSTDVELTGLSVTGKDSWVVKDYSEDLSSKSEGTKELSMSFRGDGTTSTGDVSLTKDSWVVNRSSELLLNVSAKLPKQGSEYKEKGSIAQVNYTFSVKDEPTDPVEQFTVNYVAGENGSVNESSRSFSKGSSLTFPTTTPSEGYVFDKWVDSSTELEVTGSTTVNANMTVKALFKLDDSGEPIESTISNDWSKDKVIKDSTTPVTFSYDSTSPDTRIVSVESDNTAITVEKAVDTYSLGNPGSEIWNVKAVGKGSATVTATLNTGETTQFVVKVYELNVDGGGDITIEVPDLPDKGPGDNINTGDIVIDIPITTPDGDDTITVTPEIPEGTPPLEEGENNINVSVTIDNITINITIVINIEGSGSDNPSDGLHQTVEEAQAMGFTFSPYEDGLQIDSFENKQFKSEINVPEQIGDFKVISIKERAFSGESNVKKITLPGTIKYIGSAAFSGCDNLEYVNIPSSFEKVGRNTIYHSGNGKHDSVSPFYNIDGGKLTVELEEGFTVIPAALFWGIRDEDRMAIGWGSTDYNGSIHILKLPSSTTEIQKTSKESNSNVHTSKFPDTIDRIVIDKPFGSIEGYPWESNGYVIFNDIPLKPEDFNAVAEAKLNVKFSDTLDSIIITEYTRGKQYTADVVIPEYVGSLPITEIGEKAFRGCYAIKSIKLPETLEIIGDEAFSSCDGLSTITIPNSVETIGKRAFAYCSGLSTITIPNSVETIGDNAFSYCDGLSTITIPNSVETIGKEAFAYCFNEDKNKGLSEIEIPNSVTSIGENAFTGIPHIYYNGSASGAPWGALAIN